MPNKIIMEDWHSEAWWMHVYDEELTDKEKSSWADHLNTCAECRQEWEAIQRLDALLAHPPGVPSLSPDFAIKTLEQITRQQRRRRIISIVVGSFIVAAVSFLILFVFNAAYQALEQYLRVIFSARYLLFSSLVQTILGLIDSWRTLLPFFVGLTIFIFVILMPNSALVTMTMVWYSRKQRAGLHAV